MFFSRSLLETSSVVAKEPSIYIIPTEAPSFFASDCEIAATFGLEGQFFNVCGLAHIKHFKSFFVFELSSDFEASSFFFYFDLSNFFFLSSEVSS